MRGRDIAGVIEQYTRFVKPAFDTFVAPSRKHADVIIPWGRRAPRLSPTRLPSYMGQIISCTWGCDQLLVAAPKHAHACMCLPCCAAW